MTVQQAADRLGVKAGTVYALCAARKLRHYRVGLGRGRIVVPPEAVEEYLASVCVEPGTADEEEPLRHLS